MHSALYWTRKTGLLLADFVGRGFVLAEPRIVLRGELTIFRSAITPISSAVVDAPAQIDPNADTIIRMQKAWRTCKAEFDK